MQWPVEKIIFYIQSKNCHSSNALQSCTYTGPAVHRKQQHYLQIRKHARHLVSRRYLAKPMAFLKTIKKAILQTNSNTCVQEKSGSGAVWHRWFRGFCGSGRWTVGLADLEGLLQPWWFHNPMVLWTWLKLINLSSKKILIYHLVSKHSALIQQSQSCLGKCKPVSNYAHQVSRARMSAVYCKWML